MALKISDKDFIRLVTFLQNKYGINLTKKRTLIEGRLNAMLITRGYTNYTDYINDVFRDTTGTEITTLLNKLTTNHTYFMREPEHYTFMEDVVLPYLLRTKKDKSVQIWSAGCSSGEEPYTTEMLLMEFFSKQTTKWDTRILATDISQKVLAKAQEGIYHIDGMKNLPAEWIQKYFIPLPNACYQIKQNVKDNIVFKVFNLMDPIPFTKKPFDLIFCRNVMIYFEQKVKTELVRRFYDVLAPGGYLFIGHAESIQRDATSYKYIKPAIYQKPF